MPASRRSRRFPPGRCDPERLPMMHHMGILLCMRTTINIDDALVTEAMRLTGIAEKTSLVRAGLEALIARESARRLAALGGTMPELRDVPRRRVAEPRPRR